MGGCGSCSLADTNPAAYEWGGATKPISCNPTHHTVAGGCYDWWGIKEIHEQYGSNFRARCDAHGTVQASQKVLKEAMIPLVYGRFVGKWDKVARSGKYKSATSLEWSSEYSESRASSYAKSLETAHERSQETSIGFEFGMETSVSVGASASAGADVFGVETEVSVSTELSATASSSTSMGESRSFSASKAAGEEWGREVSNTFAVTKGRTDTLECESVACDSGDLYMWTVSGITKAASKDGERKDTTRTCQFACVPHTSKVKSPKCPVQYCGNTACTCCTSNDWATIKKGIPVCGMENHVHLGNGFCARNGAVEATKRRVRVSKPGLKTEEGIYTCRKACVAHGASCTGYHVARPQDTDCEYWLAGPGADDKIVGIQESPFSWRFGMQCYKYTGPSA